MIRGFLFLRTTMPNWDPGQYLRFVKQRTQPCVDLLKRIEIERVEYAADLG